MDPSPHANSFQCNLAIEKRELAAQDIQQALVCCGTNIEHAPLKKELLECIH
jgi:hypothetical protein